MGVGLLLSIGMMSDNLIIREAIPFDRSQILCVNRTAWEQCYGHIFSQQEIKGLFNNVLRQQGSWVYDRDQHLGTWVAEMDNRVIGFIGTGNLLNGYEAEITTFYVLPAYHGRRVGQRLWYQALGCLQQAGYGGIWVWALKKASACHFYEHQGCVARATGCYAVGKHQETAIGYWYDF